MKIKAWERKEQFKLQTVAKIQVDYQSTSELQKLGQRLNRHTMVENALFKEKDMKTMLKTK